MGFIIILIIFIIFISAYGIRTTNRSKRLKQQYTARLHAVGIHQSGLPQVSEGKLVDVLLGNGYLYVLTGHQTFELSLNKVWGVRHPHDNLGSRKYLVINYEMNGRVRPIVLRFTKPAQGKAFLWEIERELFTKNSNDSVIRL